jgi:hypothetical protein
MYPLSILSAYPLVSLATKPACSHAWSVFEGSVSPTGYLRTPVPHVPTAAARVQHPASPDKGTSLPLYELVSIQSVFAALRGAYLHTKSSRRPSVESGGRRDHLNHPGFAFRSIV